MAMVEISRDTAGVAGAPNIGDTIYQKIEMADILVADVTIINSGWEGRKTPNPNVMIELGYTIKSLGWEHIVLLYNSDYGDVEELPFDINHQRMTAFSFQNEEKVDARNRIIGSISATIELLKAKGELHGGKPVVINARKKLAALLIKAMQEVYEFYHDRHCDRNEGIKNFVPISDTQLENLEQIHEMLTDRQYFDLSHLLQKLKLAVTGSSDAYGWEYADEIGNQYFDKIYIQYGEFMYQMPLQFILNEEFVALYNSVAIENQIIYQPERILDGKRCFIHDRSVQKGWDKNGNLLCDGVEGNGLFTGFCRTREYIGEYVKSMRHGFGKERSNIIGRKRFECGEYRRTGKWKDNIFIEGIVYSAVVMRRSDGDFEYLPTLGAHEAPLTADDLDTHCLLGGLNEEELRTTYLADMTLKDGKYDIIDGFLRELSQYDEIGLLLNEDFGQPEAVEEMDDVQEESMLDYKGM